MAEHLRKCGSDYETFAEKIDGRGDYFIEGLLKVYDRDTKFKVLCHGDFHSKNLLFRNDCAKDEDLLFVSFKFSKKSFDKFAIH